jgi:hypothetical protein
MWSKLQNFKYTFTFILAILVAIVLFQSHVFESLVVSLGSYGYISAFIAGLFFSYTFTSPSAAFYLVRLGEHLNPWPLAIIAGIGAMLSDLLMYRYVKEGLLEEIKTIGKLFVPIHRREQMENFTKKRVFLWSVPFFASILIASPFPDELGVTLFGLINFKPKYLSIITFLLNTSGILVLVFIGYTVAH